MKKVHSSLKERVEAGAAFLTAFKKGWEKKIDLDELDLSSDNRRIRRLMW